MIIAHICIDNVVLFLFEATFISLIFWFVETKSTTIVMNMIGDLTYFIALQIKHTKDGVVLTQIGYLESLLQRIDLQSVKLMKSPMGLTYKLDKEDVGVSVVPTLQM